MTERKKKPLYEGDVACAWCNKQNHLKLERKILSPSVPAEVEVSVSVERSTQTTLEVEA